MRWHGSEADGESSTGRQGSAGVPGWEWMAGPVGKLGRGEGFRPEAIKVVSFSLFFPFFISSS
jgi:hypothetical protein